MLRVEGLGKWRGFACCGLRALESGGGFQAKGERRAKSLDKNAARPTPKRRNTETTKKRRERSKAREQGKRGQAREKGALQRAKKKICMWRRPGVVLLVVC
jgi:hypothetical protein